MIRVLALVLTLSGAATGDVAGEKESVSWVSSTITRIDRPYGTANLRHELCCVVSRSGRTVVDNNHGDRQFARCVCDVAKFWVAFAPLADVASYWGSVLNSVYLVWPTRVSDTVTH